MSEDRNDFEINLVEEINFLKKSKGLLIFLSLFSALIFGFYSFTLPEKYLSKVIMVPSEEIANSQSLNGISTITVEYVAKKAGVSLRSVSLWKARYSKQIGGVCYFTFDTPKGPKTCWSSTAKSENEKVAYFMGAPNIPVLVQDPGKTPFLVVGHCNDFRPKTRN